jgi:mannose-6-phosphate isomerase-like protein (cupin superfamily)
MARHEEGKVNKGWGQEIIWATNDMYCGKILSFKEGGKMSMHFHLNKHETWYVLEGSFMVNKINTENAEKYTTNARKGSTIVNKPGEPHQVICMQEGKILEVSTPDSIEDNYRVAKGDSQK